MNLCSDTRSCRASAGFTRRRAGSWIIWAAPPAAKAGITKGKCYLSADNKLLPII